ncbi:MAG TPA: DUF1569 domain-containing protein [Pyrinomonadaceae bacterium]|nr:DUF1569 domain-containing protein [Pyrinomonadaceae bacterium]
MNSLFDSAKREELINRINKLTPESKAVWGKFSIGEMLCHCADGIKMATGELEVKDKSTFLFRHVVKPLVIYVLPMPKGAPTADEINPTISGTKPSEFEADRQALLDSIKNLYSLPANHIWANHAAFGRLSHQQWGLLHYKHIDHHLKQFGV